MIQNIFRRFYIDGQSTAEIAKAYNVTEHSIVMMMQAKEHRVLREHFISIYRRGDAA